MFDIFKSPAATHDGACLDLSTWKVEAGGTGVQTQPHSELKPGLH